MKDVLLVEPNYKNKYPPLGLMKISSYHKFRGDRVTFVKGCRPEIREKRWDRIYVSSLFTFYWKITIDTIKYYLESASNPNEVFVGGVMATLMADEIREETGVRVIAGLLNRRGILDSGAGMNIDHLIPDYSILKDIEYQYAIEDAYIGYATRGCPNSCGFCAVKIIEPDYVTYLPIKKQVQGIEELYGVKQHLVLLDNNVLASSDYDQIIRDIIELGFHKDARINNRKRHVDFNQGVDAHLLDKKKLSLLAKTAIKPLRIAFDHISLKKMYVEKIKLARDCGLLDLSNYVLYNYRDTPRDFYQRLLINVQLNEQIGTKIFSFPMKYIPLDARDRSYVGPKWSRQLLRGVQCILLATLGKVGPKEDFFKAAFGSSSEEFIKIAMMPENYIIYRRKTEFNGADDWGHLYDTLTQNQKNELFLITKSRFVEEQDVVRAGSARLKKILTHYIEARRIRNTI